MLHELLFYNTSTHPKGKDMPLNFRDRIYTCTKKKLSYGPKIIISVYVDYILEIGENINR